MFKRVSSKKERILENQISEVEQELHGAQEEIEDTLKIEIGERRKQQG